MPRVNNSYYATYGGQQVVPYAGQAQLDPEVQRQRMAIARGLAAPVTYGAPTPMMAPSGGGNPPSAPSGSVGGGVAPSGAAPSGGDVGDGNLISRIQKALERKRASSTDYQLQQAAGAAGNFAGQGEAGYGNMTAELAAERERLRRLASGEDSIAREQVRQGTQQQLAAQQAYAASASPQNSVMAARNAANNMARANYGAAGQSALAQLAERQAATQALAQLNLGQRDQDVNVGLGSRGNQINALTANKKPKEPSNWQKALAAGGALAPLFSDERLKTNVKDGDKAARKALETLGAKTYRYKDPKFGAGEQFGVMAQKLEKAGLTNTVIDTPEGKMIDTNKLTGVNTGLIAALGRRVAKLEKGR